MLKNKRIMTVLAHPDDETLGCGGTLHRFNAYPTHCLIPVRRIEEQCKKALKELGRGGSYSFGDFEDNRMDAVPLADVSSFVEHGIEIFEPDVIITHHSNCMNQDHRVLYQACSIATRPVKHRIPLFTCEVLSSTGYLRPSGFEPNYYVPISEDDLEAKIKALMEYSTELRADRSPEAVRALATLRGAESGTKYAEAFMLVRGFDEA